MIVYVSPAEINGGILQFSTALAKETSSFEKCILFVPDVIDDEFLNDIQGSVIKYKKIKTLNSGNAQIADIAQKIADLSPKAVVFTEDSILMQQLCRILHKKGIKTAMTVHDIQHHPYRKMGFRKLAVDTVRRMMTKKTVKKCTKIILLSKNSEKTFKKEYKAENTVLFRLPAHVPNVIPENVKELSLEGKNYFLFFGRIDEYKGIGRLCRAYTSLPEQYKQKNELVIAGKGNLSDEESALIQADKHIHIVSRFITDGEMIWLFQNCKAVVLPYTEASQSGVLPIAYKYGKPVVVSDLDGLTENVIDKKTGYIFKTENELASILHKLNADENMRCAISDYYAENYNWKHSIEKLLNDIESDKTNR